MGVLMNTRGIVQLVVLNIGVQLKVISPVIFAMFVLMATILTFITSPILHLLYHRDADSKILEESQTAKDLHLALEGVDNNYVKEVDGITTVSNGIVFPQSVSSPSLRSHTESSHRGDSLVNETGGGGGVGVASTPNPNLRMRKASRMTLF